MNARSLKTPVSPSPPLVKLGLSRDEARCYEILAKEGPQEAKNIGLALAILPNAVYRLITGLIQKGLVIKLENHPVRFQAIPPSVAINALASSKIREIEEYKNVSISTLSSNQQINSGIDVITGRKDMFTKSAQLINQANKEVLIISIGEPVPDEIKLANRDAINRNVEIRFIVHKSDQENHLLLESWVKMGLQVRHYPGSGYHMSIFDGKTCLLSASNPKNPAERSSMLIKSEGLANAMRNYFNSLWVKALPIKLR
jgi:sugar-specific transcriptional regulator TrmB